MIAVVALGLLVRPSMGTALRNRRLASGWRKGAGNTHRVNCRPTFPDARNASGVLFIGDQTEAADPETVGYPQK